MCPVTIGIGSSGDIRKVFDSISAGGFTSRVCVYCTAAPSVPAPQGIDICVGPDPAESLIGDLVQGTIAAAVRGTLPANRTLSLLKEKNGVECLLRAALLETFQGKRFLLAPVGIDEGWSVGQKIDLAGRARELAVRLGLPDRIGILSGGRFGDIGRQPEVDRSLADAELLARMTGGKHYEILIEDAIRDCGVIIAPDGIAGNLIFRTLVFLGSGKGHGAPVLNIENVFVDTSRATPYYANAIRLAESLLKERTSAYR